MSRLRPVSTHQNYGYVSRVDGDRKLVDRAVQDTFFRELCSRHQLRPFGVYDRLSSQDTAEASERQPNIEGRDTEICLASIRKLREGVISSGRVDEVAVDIFERSVAFAILAGHVETYFPALQHLLNVLYQTAPAADGIIQRRQKIQAMGELLLLHFCSRRQFVEFQIAKAKFCIRECLADDLLRILLQNNWVRWHRLKGNSCNTVLQNKIMDVAHSDVSNGTFAAIAAAYHIAEICWLERVCGSQWQRACCDSQMEMKGEYVMLRITKGRGLS